MNRTNRRKNIFAAALYMAEIMEQTTIDETADFTGKINFTVNCNNGGIGDISAFTQHEILRKNKINIDNTRER